MRRSLWLSLVAVVAVLTGCADTAGIPAGTRPAGPQVIASPSGGTAGCSVGDLAAAIDAALLQLYIKNVWPDENSVKGKFKAVKDALAAGDIVAARAAALVLTNFITTKFNNLTTAEKAAVQALYDQVTTDINCFVGIYDLNPGDPETAFQVPGVGGVNFPPNVVAIGTQVTITEVQGQICPLNTDLDCFSSFLSIELSPPAVLPQPAVVVLCPPNLISTLAVAHQDQNGFEILTPTTDLGLLQTGLVCPTPLGQTSGSRNWLTRVADLLSPTRLEAAPMMYFLGGIGGLTTKFSPFGLVNTTIIGTGGLGGKTTSFTPPAAAAPNAAAPVNPPLPASYLQGDAGTSTTTGLPFVTIQTPGGDADGVNPIAGITVTFKTGPSAAYELDSEAKVCDALGVVPASGEVQVVTDVNGVATLPCLAYGNKAGFANLSATFDPTTLNFPNSNLVTIAAIEGTSSGSSLNWLVKSNALQPTALSFVTAPSGSAGAGVPLAQQPAIQLRDALGNEVYTGGITVTASVTDGGGTASYTGPVTTDADGVATFTDLSIGGPAGPQTLSFNLGGAGLLNHVVQLTAGPAVSIMTFIGGTEALSYSYGTGLTAYSNVSPAPQVIVKDAYGNPVGGQPVAWTASTSNGGVLTVGAGTPTTAAGTAEVSSWLLGDGLNQASASLSLLGVLDAQFTASTPTGISIFACNPGTGTSKTDLGPLSIKAPNGTTKEVTIWMSITGQSSSLTSYPATFEARLNGPTGTLLKSTTGNVQLPGDNGNPVPVTFSFPTSIAKQSPSSTIWFNLAITAPATRKPQVWYRNATYKSNETCYDSKAYAPGSTTVFKRGLSINVTN